MELKFFQKFIIFIYKKVGMIATSVLRGISFITFKPLNSTTDKKDRGYEIENKRIKVMKCSHLI